MYEHRLYAVLIELHGISRFYFGETSQEFSQRVSGHFSDMSRKETKLYDAIKLCDVDKAWFIEIGRISGDDRCELSEIAKKIETSLICEFDSIDNGLNTTKSFCGHIEDVWLEKAKEIKCQIIQNELKKYELISFPQFMRVKKKYKFDAGLLNYEEINMSDVYDINKANVQIIANTKEKSLTFHVGRNSKANKNKKFANYFKNHQAEILKSSVKSDWLCITLSNDFDNIELARAYANKLFEHFSDKGSVRGEKSKQTSDAITNDSVMNSLIAYCTNVLKSPEDFQAEYSPNIFKDAKKTPTVKLTKKNQNLFDGASQTSQKVTFNQLDKLNEEHRTLYNNIKLFVENEKDLPLEESVTLGGFFNLCINKILTDVNQNL